MERGRGIVKKGKEEGKPGWVYKKEVNRKGRGGVLKRERREGRGESRGSKREGGEKWKAEGIGGMGEE